MTRIDRIHLVGWCTLFIASSTYGLFALSVAGLQILMQLGLAPDTLPRSMPGTFILHALFGGLCLLTGPLQFSRRLRHSRVGIHRGLGLLYVASVAVASVSAFWLAMTFDVSVPSKIVFSVLALLWFGTTATALQRAVRRRISSHREWMIRSFALTFFFVTFSFWVPALSATSLPQHIAYPLGVFLSWALNLAAAETHVRRTRPTNFKPSVSVADGLLGVAR